MCAPGSSCCTCPAPVRWVSRAAAVFLVAVLLAGPVSAAAALAGSVLGVALVAVLTADAVGIWAVYRLVRYGALRRPREAAPVLPVAAVGALPASTPRAIEAPRTIPGVVIVSERKVAR